ncbi:MAG TPA: hypothetical protein VE263_22030 [Candidatus Angelobacter sp.]|nr:hypothetical protein [Candidatus Angelobacter sp.]
MSTTIPACLCAVLLCFLVARLSPLACRAGAQQAPPSPSEARKPGEHRTLTVRVHGTTSKIPLEARNLAPDIADLTGGNPVRASSSGEKENLARFEVTGRKNGSFLISIHLVPVLARPH